MTAPVIQESAGAGQWTVSFVLPGARALADYPIPDDPGCNCGSSRDRCRCALVRPLDLRQRRGPH